MLAHPFRPLQASTVGPKNHQSLADLQSYSRRIRRYRAGSRQLHVPTNSVLNGCRTSFAMYSDDSR